MKKTIRVLLVMMVLFVFASCGTSIKSTDTANSLNPVEAVSGSSSPNTQEIYSPLSVDTVSFETVTKPSFTVYGSGNDNGFYEVFQNEDSSRNIMYVDYNTQQQIYLCAQPNCQHNSESCTSWIPPYSGSVFPVALDGKIALVYNAGSDALQEVSRVDILDANGANKRTLCTFVAGTYIDNGAAVNDKEIILKIDQFGPSDSGNINVTQSIVAVNQSDGSITSLYQISSESNDIGMAGGKALFFRGSTEAGIIIKTIEVGYYEQTDDGNETIDNMYQATTHTVYVIPKDGSELKELLSFKQGTIYEEVFGDSLYYLANNSGRYSLNRIRTDTMEQEVIIQDFADTNIETPLPECEFSDLTINELVDGHIMIDFTKSNTYTDGGDMELVIGRYAVDTETGQLSEITLSNYFRATGIPVYIVKNMGENLLVHARIEEMPIDGSPIPRTQRTLGLMSAEDYILSNPNYLLIDTQIFSI